jgi:hypothetical protein
MVGFAEGDDCVVVASLTFSGGSRAKTDVLASPQIHQYTNIGMYVNP